MSIPLNEITVTIAGKDITFVSSYLPKAKLEHLVETKIKQVEEELKGKEASLIIVSLVVELNKSSIFTEAQYKAKTKEVIRKAFEEEDVSTSYEDDYEEDEEWYLPDDW